MDKQGRQDKDDPRQRQGVDAMQLYQSDRNTRQLTKNQGLDPGEGPDMTDLCDGFHGPDDPTLEQLTRTMDHPPIGEVGKPRMPLHSPRTGSTGKARR